MDLAYIGIHESHTHGLDSLPWMAWQTEDQTVVISLKTPMVNMCQNQNFFKLIYSCLTMLCRFRCGTTMVAQRVKKLLAKQETRVQSLGREDPVEKEMATCSRILA